MKKTILSSLLIPLLWVSAAQAVPTLQVYIDGATYDEVAEDWVTTSSVVELWVIGNTGGGSGGDIVDIHLTAAYQVDSWPGGPGPGGTGPAMMPLSLVPTNPESEYQPNADQPVEDFYGPNGTTQVAQTPGAIPIREDGNEIATHGIYGLADVQFDQWHLGTMFNTNTTTIQDMVLGGNGGYSQGHIWKYSINTSGYGAVHFDVFNHIDGTYAAAAYSEFNPWSHDGSTIPEPTTAFMLGASLIGLAGVRALRRRRQH